MIKIIESTILIIDDDDLICETLSDIFQEKGYDVVIAGNGREAINKAEQMAFDIAFIDIMLPDINGIDLLKEFKKMYPDRVYIIITGYASLQNAISALKDGADDYFIKPLRIEDLIHRAKEALEKQRLRLKLKESEERFKSLYKGIPIPTYTWQIVGNDLILINYNAAAEKITDFKIKDILGINASELYKNRPEILDELHRCAIEKVSFSREIKYIYNVTKKEKYLSVKYGYVPPDLVLVHTEDITEKKKLEQKLKESEKKYREAYNQANFYKDLFAHDINNILNNIKSSAELISMFLNNPEELKDTNEMLDIIKDQAIRGAQLISNVRKLSQLEEGIVSIKSMDVYKVLNEAKEFLKKSFKTRNINIHVDFIRKKLFVQANDLLFEVFENVLNNAVKYNNNSTIEIFVRISKSQKEKIKYLKIEFIDNGIGIRDGRKETIFQRAYTKDISKRGMGFGLSLVKKIIESYKGEIWIEDKVKGDRTKRSNFILLIPEVI